MSTTPEDKKICFVIGPIGEEGSATRHNVDTLYEYIIKPAVEPLDFEVKRADKVPVPGTITDRLISDTLRSRLGDC